VEPPEPRPSQHAGVHLLRSADRAEEVDALADRLGGRVGLRGVLADLDRRARAVRVPAPAAVWGFRWDHEDMRSPRWWPQGITTSADSATGAAGDDVDGRQVLMTSSYSHELDGISHGARLTLVDLTDPSDLRYRHVLLVEPFLHDDGSVDVRPVTVHAGGIVWHGDHVHVAGTARGFSSFRLDDIVRAPAGDATRLRVTGERVDTFGYRYLLPVRFTYDAHAGDGTDKLRYSFASLDRSTSPHRLVAGEYGRGDMTNRLVRYEIDPVSSLLHAETDGRSVPLTLDAGGVPGMQGATVVDDTWFVTTSRGRFRLGSVWVGRPGELVEHRWQLPVGPEDITYWPARDQLWSLSEYPGARYVYAMPRGRFLRGTT
jgi:hypothetical protein